jgi:DNA-directed RNA polymerase subunit RPC12/RpoP
MRRSGWVVACTSCKKRFPHSELGDARDLAEYFFPPKPEIPETGFEMKCPHCGTIGQYQRSDLRYEANLQ